MPNHCREAVNAIVYDKNEDQVLVMLRQDLPIWVLPGGAVDLGETPEQAAIREVREETGLEIELIRKIARYQPTNPITEITHLYAGRVVSGNPTTQAETRDLEFLPIEKAKARLFSVHSGWLTESLYNTDKLIERPLTEVTNWAILKIFFQHPLLGTCFLIRRIRDVIKSKIGGSQ